MQKLDRFLAPLLATLSVVAIFGVFACSGEPVFLPFRGTSIEPILLRLGYANSIIFNLCVGFLTSVFFWLLVVYIPERNRKNLLLNNFRRRYKDFRQSTIQIMLWCAIGSHDSQLPTQLLDQKEFRSFFDANEKKRWYEFLNGLQENSDRMDDLLLEMALFSQEVSYVLNNVRIQDPQPHSFFKLLNEHIYRLRNAKVYSYDMVKYLGSFLWEINSNWNFFTGYQDHDPITRMIESL